MIEARRPSDTNDSAAMPATLSGIAVFALSLSDSNVPISNGLVSDTADEACFLINSGNRKVSTMKC